MVYTIEGFSQQTLVNFGCDANDAILLRWFVNWMATGKMETRAYRNESYYWIKYEHVIRELPILGITNPIALGNRLKKLCKKCILKFKLFGARQDQKTCYAINQKALIALLTSSKIEKTADNDNEQDDSSVRFTQKCIKKLGSSKSEPNSPKNNRSNQPQDNGSQTLVHPKVNQSLPPSSKLGSSKSEADHNTNNDHNTKTTTARTQNSETHHPAPPVDVVVDKTWISNAVKNFRDAGFRDINEISLWSLLCGTRKERGYTPEEIERAFQTVRAQSNFHDLTNPIGLVRTMLRVGVDPTAPLPENCVPQGRAVTLPEPFEAEPPPKREPLPPDDPQVWPTVQTLLQEHVKPRTYEQWLRPLKLLNIEDNVAKIGAPNETCSYWLYKNYEKLISDDISTVLGSDVPIQIQFVSHKAAPHSPKIPSNMIAPRTQQYLNAVIRTTSARCAN